MTGRWQAALALVLAIALHLVAFALRPDVAGASSGGVGGMDTATIAAAHPALAELVATWDTAPDMPAQSEAPAAPPPETTLPEVPQAEAPPQLAAPLALAQPVAEAPPTADVSLPPPEAPPKQAKPSAAPLPLAAREPAPKRPSPKQAEQPKVEKPAAKPKAEKSRKTKAAQGQSQKAAGRGGGDTAGTAKPSKAQTANLARQWGAAIQARIERRLRKSVGVGRVTVQVTVARSGQLLAMKIARSSGQPALDEAAMRAVRAAGRLPDAPKGFAADSHSFNLPLRFTR